MAPSIPALMYPDKVRQPGVVAYVYIPSPAPNTLSPAHSAAPAVTTPPQTIEIEATDAPAPKARAYPSAVCLPPPSA